MNPTCSPKLLRKPHSLWAASVMSRPNLTAKKGRDWGHNDATSTLCFDTSHFWRGQRNSGDNVRYCSKSNKTTPWLPRVSEAWLVAHCTLLSARTRSTSLRLCWEIFRLSSSDRQPSQDRQALSSNWDPSCTLGGKKRGACRVEGFTNRSVHDKWDWWVNWHYLSIDFISLLVWVGTITTLFLVALCVEDRQFDSWLTASKTSSNSAWRRAWTDIFNTRQSYRNRKSPAWCSSHTSPCAFLRWPLTFSSGCLWIEGDIYTHKSTISFLVQIMSSPHVPSEALARWLLPAACCWVLLTPPSSECPLVLSQAARLS